MAGERLPARFSLRSELRFRWTGKCFETATSHMQTVVRQVKTMTTKRGILTLIAVAFIAIALHVSNRLLIDKWSVPTMTGFDYFLFALFILTILATVVVALTKKRWLYILTFSTTTLFLALSLVSFYDIIHLRSLSKTMERIDKMETCEDAKLMFDEDVADGKVKYFTVGYAQDGEAVDYLSKTYDLTVYHIGCSPMAGPMCYNELVEKEIIKNQPPTKPKAN